MPAEIVAVEFEVNYAEEPLFGCFGKMAVVGARLSVAVPVKLQQKLWGWMKSRWDCNDAACVLRRLDELTAYWWMHIYLVVP